MDDIGPVEYLIVSFPGNQFKGEILPELANLVESGTIRIIDLAFVGKDATGNTLMFELSDLDPAIQKEFGAMGAESGGLFNEEDLKVVFAGETDNLASQTWRADLEKAKRKHPAATVLTRLNVTRAVREAERRDLIDNYHPPLNG